MTPQDLIAVFDDLAEAPNAADRLRELILRLAVRGELVPQNPDDESADNVLNRVTTEQLIPPPRRVAPVVDEECPWELPSSWTWVRLRQVADFSLGKTPPTKNSAYWVDEGGYPWVSISDMTHGEAVNGTKRRVSEKAREEVFRGPPSSAGTMLMSFKLSIGKVSRLEAPAYHNEAIISLTPATAGIDAYLYTTLAVFAGGGDVNAAIKGNTLNKSSLTNLLVALPPEGEQRRIVERVDELMGLLDRLEAARDARETTRKALRDSALAALQEADTPEEVESAWQRIAGNIHDLFTTPEDVEPLRQTILQLAVRGRLVPQDPRDEPAAQLLGRIEAEKAELVKAKTIRKPKELGRPSTAEVSFLPPVGWTWCRINDVVISLVYGTSAKSLKAGSVPVLRMGNLQRGEIDWTDLKYTSDVDVIQKYGLQPGSVLFNRTNSPELVGKTAIYRGEQPAAFAGYLIHIAQGCGVDPEFLNLVMNAPNARHWCWSVKSDGVSQSNISGSKLATMPLALPPTNEQSRIVKATKAVTQLLDELEAKLRNAAASHDAFAAAAVHHLET